MEYFIVITPEGNIKLSMDQILIRYNLTRSKVLELVESGKPYNGVFFDEIC